MVYESQKRASRKYELEKTDNIRVRVKKGERDLVKKLAETNDESINEMINRLIHEEAKRLKIE